jgi:Protein of unknown function (DUF1194)
MATPTSAIHQPRCVSWPPRRGIVINGLVILNEEPRLGDYYQKRVIGGPGSFVLQISNFDDFARAIRMKLIEEIEVSMAMRPLRPVE